MNESTLAQVPSALLGGLGRSNFKFLADTGSTCTPTTAFGACADVTITLPARAHVLVLGRITGNSKSMNNSGDGRCRISSTATGPIPESTVALHSWTGLDDWVHAPLMVVTPAIGPGEVSFYLDCRTYQPNSMRFIDADLVAVALSPS